LSWALTLTLGTSQHARLCRMRLMAHTQLWQPCHLTSSLVCHCHLTYLPAKHHAMRDGNYLYASSISWQDAASLGLASDFSTLAQRQPLVCTMSSARSVHHAGSAAVPCGRSSAGALLGSPSSSGTLRTAAPSRGGLTSSQAAAQLALCNGSSSPVNGLVPVRTGLAWATIGKHLTYTL